MIRIHVSILFLCVTTFVIHAQDTSKYLLNNPKSKLTTFYASIAPMTAFSSLNNQSVNVMDVSAGIIVNKQYYLGYFMSGSNNVNVISVPEFASDEYWDWLEAGVELDKLSSSTEFVYANFRHSGLKAGYIHNPDGFVSYRVGGMFGFIGGFQLSENKSFLGMFDNIIFKNKVITAEPHAGVILNLLPWWRMNLDLGYRFINVDPRILSAPDADSFTFKLSFAFGKFS